MSNFKSQAEIKGLIQNKLRALRVQHRFFKNEPASKSKDKSVADIISKITVLEELLTDIEKPS